MEQEFSLTLKGFKTKQQVEEFLAWYGNCGEQASAYWFECRDNLDGVEEMNVDYKKKEKWVDNNLTAHLKMIK